VIEVRGLRIFQVRALLMPQLQRRVHLPIHGTGSKRNIKVEGYPREPWPKFTNFRNHVVECLEPLKMPDWHQILGREILAFAMDIATGGSPTEHSLPHTIIYISEAFCCREKVWSD
jgi:hypothetical protein